MLGPYRLTMDFLRFQKEYGATLTTEVQTFCLLPVHDSTQCRWFIGPREDVLDWLDANEPLYYLIQEHAILLYQDCGSGAFVEMAPKLWNALLLAGYDEKSFRTSREEYEAAFKRGEENGRSIFSPEPFMAPLDSPPGSPILLAMRHGGFSPQGPSHHQDTLNQQAFFAQFMESQGDEHLAHFALDRHPSQSPLITSKVA